MQMTKSSRTQPELLISDILSLLERDLMQMYQKSYHMWFCKTFHEFTYVIHCRPNVIIMTSVLGSQNQVMTTFSQYRCINTGNEYIKSVGLYALYCTKKYRLWIPNLSSFEGSGLELQSHRWSTTSLPPFWQYIERKRAYISISFR